MMPDPTCFLQHSVASKDLCVSSRFLTLHPCRYCSQDVLLLIALKGVSFWTVYTGVRQDRWSMDVQKVPQGMGSGFFWDDKGHIVTNYHVIRGAADIKVALIDQSVWSAKVSPFGCWSVWTCQSPLSAAYIAVDTR